MLINTGNHIKEGTIDIKIIILEQLIAKNIGN